MSKHLYKIEQDEDGVKIELQGQTSVYLRKMPKAKAVCWDNNGNSFEIKVQNFMDSNIITPIGKIEFPAYIDLRPPREITLLYTV